MNEAPADLDPLLAMAREEYIPYLVANTEAILAGKNEVRWVNLGVDWTTPTSPYRARCLANLQRVFQTLNAPARNIISDRLSPQIGSLLAAPIAPSSVSEPTGAPRDRNWR